MILNNFDFHRSNWRTFGLRFLFWYFSRFFSFVMTTTAGLYRGTNAHLRICLFQSKLRQVTKSNHSSRLVGLLLTVDQYNSCIKIYWLPKTPWAAQCFSMRSSLTILHMELLVLFSLLREVNQHRNPSDNLQFTHWIIWHCAHAWCLCCLRVVFVFAIFFIVNINVIRLPYSLLD